MAFASLPGALLTLPGVPRVVNEGRFIADLALLPTVGEASLLQGIHDVAPAETFVDPTRFAGTCYRAANWCEIASTRGHAKRGNRYQPHAQPKRVWVYPLHRRRREPDLHETSRRISSFAVSQSMKASLPPVSADSRSARREPCHSGAPMEVA